MIIVISHLARLNKTAKMINNLRILCYKLCQVNIFSKGNIRTEDKIARETNVKLMDHPIRVNG